MKTCPICEEGTVKKGKIHEELYGVDLGEFPAEICTRCGESFTTAETMKEIESIAKQKGIWGMGKKTVVARTGNSLAVRIPKNIVEFSGIKEGGEVYIHPEKGKIVIDI